jgi:hypothetical protein
MDSGVLFQSLGSVDLLDGFYNGTYAEYNGFLYGRPVIIQIATLACHTSIHIVRISRRG